MKKMPSQLNQLLVALVIAAQAEEAAREELVKKRKALEAASAAVYTFEDEDFLDSYAELPEFALIGLGDDLYLIQIDMDGDGQHRIIHVDVSAEGTS